MDETLLSFLEQLRAMGRSRATILARKFCLDRLFKFLHEKEILNLADVTPRSLELFVVRIRNFSRKSGRKFSVSRIRNYVIAVKMFFEYAHEQGLILSNPAEAIEIPKKVDALPKAILTLREVVRLLNAPDMTRLLGLRDRAALEIFYSTGIRQAELVALDVFDVQAEKQTLFIRKGKFNRGRVVPIGRRALFWLDKYLARRYKLLRFATNDALFLDQTGNRVGPKALATRLHGYKKAAKIEKSGGFHLFRHSMATHMVERGADIRSVQEILGHENLSTTEIYTRVALPHLKHVYQKAQAALYG
jgi:integrase/recombinase XerD